MSTAHAWLVAELGKPYRIISGTEPQMWNFVDRTFPNWIISHISQKKGDTMAVRCNFYTGFYGTSEVWLYKINIESLSK